MNERRLQRSWCTVCQPEASYIALIFPPANHASCSPAVVFERRREKKKEDSRESTVISRWRDVICVGEVIALLQMSLEEKNVQPKIAVNNLEYSVDFSLCVRVKNLPYPFVPFCRNGVNNSFALHVWVSETQNDGNEGSMRRAAQVRTNLLFPLA